MQQAQAGTTRNSNTMSSPITRIKDYYGECVQELKNCSWPDKPELIQSTVLVIIATLILTGFTLCVDQIAQFFIRMLIGAGA
jgi:preprotein translocase SecE subunit